ncbi:MAG: hypothetical protein JNK04_20555 [Myxococcales bacterium]|nr:hypothetical protein [Myxococcales bacterium]
MIGRSSAFLVGVMLLGWSAACSDDSTTPAGGAGTGGAAAGGAAEGGAAEGCPGVTLLENPADTALPGPWPVGARSVTIAGLDAEVWYPATVGSEAGADAISYDVRAYLPAAEAAKIADADAPRQACDCFRDLPLDETHGPYPVVVFVHGTAGFRTQSLEIVTHWASRGFVVIAADHPGLYLADLITSLPMCDGDAPPQDLAGDINALLDAVASPDADLSFLADHIDTTRVALSGHSAGGGAIEDFGDRASVLMPMAAGGVAAGSSLESALVLGAQDDQVVAYSAQVNGYESSEAPKKRLVGLSPAGHLVFSSLCAITNAAGEDMVTIGTNADVCGLALAGALFDCDASYVAAARGWEIVNDVTSAVLEETLQCAPSRADGFATLQDRYPEVAELQEALE